MHIVFFIGLALVFVSLALLVVRHEDGVPLFVIGAIVILFGLGMTWTSHWTEHKEQKALEQMAKDYPNKEILRVKFDGDKQVIWKEGDRLCRGVPSKYNGRYVLPEAANCSILPDFVLLIALYVL